MGLFVCLFVDPFFQMFYLLNRVSKSRTVFTVAFLASRFSNYPTLVDFDELFWGKFMLPASSNLCFSVN